MPAMLGLSVHIKSQLHGQNCGNDLYDLDRAPTVEIQHLSLQKIRHLTGQNVRPDKQFSRTNFALLTDINFKLRGAVTRLQWAQYLPEGLPVTRTVM